jgi:predicted ester cyclase
VSTPANKAIARRALEQVCSGRDLESADQCYHPSVDDQIAEDDRVASRWTMEGTRDGRKVSFSGVTISRFADGRIREDWTYFDSAELVRQLEKVD